MVTLLDCPGVTNRCVRVCVYVCVCDRHRDFEIGTGREKTETKRDRERDIDREKAVLVLFFSSTVYSYLAFLPEEVAYYNTKNVHFAFR